MMLSFRPRRQDRFSRVRFVGLVVVLAALAGGALVPLATQHGSAAQTSLPPVSAACPRIVVPAYFNQTSEWAPTIAAAPYVEFIILNPSSGPGEVPDAVLQGYVQQAQAAGIRIVGYIYTDLARRGLVDLAAEIRTYEAWYGVDGIFIDGAQHQAQYIPYYRVLARLIRATGPDETDGIVFFNPGFVPDEGFMEIADIVGTYEWYYDRYTGAEFPDWIDDYPASRFFHIIHDTPSDEVVLQQVLDLAEQRNTGYLYITDRVESAAYGSLPSNWDVKLDRLC